MRITDAYRRLIILAAVALCLAVASAASAGSLPGLLTGSGQNVFAIRPASIAYTGDGSGILGRFPTGHRGGSLRWTRWTTQSATATGTVWLDSCEPSCAQGAFHGYRVSVTASRTQDRHFTRLTLRYRYQGRAVTDTRVLERIGATYMWGIAQAAA